jgi:hypothetical protein
MPARGHGAKWPRLLKPAARMLAKVLVAGGTYQEAAERMDVSRATMFLWARLLAFQTAYHHAWKRLRAAEVLTLESATYAKPENRNGESTKAEQAA